MKQCYFYCVINPFHTKAIEGGEQTAKNIIGNIELCDYKVTVITPKKYQLPDNADLAVYNDIFNDPEGNNWFTGEQYSELLNTQTPFLISECAYTACTVKPYGQTLTYDEDLSKLSRHFFMRAARSIFASPLHQKTMEKFLGLTLDNTYLYLREVDTEHFNPKSGIERKREYLHIGTFNYFKGTDQVIKEYHDKDLIIGGFGHLPSNIGKAQFIGQVPYELLPYIYSQAKNFVHLPRWKESFSRTICEASLCGCNIIGNENIGVLSWNLNLSDPQIYMNSKTQFIEMINNLNINER